MQSASGLIEQAKATRAWLQLACGQHTPTRTAGQDHPALTTARETLPGPGQLPGELLAEMNSPPKHRLYSEIMKKHDTIHPRR